MEWNVVRKWLRAILCDLYPREDRIRVILDDAGVQPECAAWSSTVSSIWHEILSSLHARRELARFLEKVLEDAPNREDLRDAIGAYRQLVEDPALPSSLLAPGTSQVPDIATNLAPGSREGGFASLAALGALVAQAQGLDPTLFRSTSVSLDPPPLPSRLARRSRTVEQVLYMLKRGEFPVLLGEALTGKTVLARLAVEGHEKPVCWIRLTGTNSERATHDLDASLAALAGPPPLFDRRSWYSEACRRLGSGSLVVIDDLPSFEAGDTLPQRLSAFLLCCREQSVGLIATTSVALPADLDGGPSAERLATFPVPPLDQEDVVELLRSWGAPGEFAARAARLVHLTCRCHPFIISAACAYLRRRGWRLGDEEFDALLGAAPAESIIADVERRLRRTVTDPSTRELLFRLALVGDRFPVEIADSVAAVPPGLDRPRERLADLTGHWVKEPAGGMFEVSPLLSRLAEQRLPERRRIKCHRRIGSALIRRRFNQHQATIAISHMHRAGEFDRAGSLLFMVLFAGLRETRELPDGLIFSMWSATELPGGMSSNVRLVLRAVQVEIAKRLRKPTDFLLVDLSRLVSEAGPDDRFGLMAAATFLSSRTDAGTLPVTLTVIRKLQCLSDETPARTSRSERRSEEALGLPEGLTIGRLLPALIVGIDSPQDLFDWLEAVLHLSEIDRRILFLPEDTSLFFPAAADFLITVERRKPESERDWLSVLGAIEAFGDRALGEGCEELWASAVRARVIVLAGVLGRLDEAVALSKIALLQCSKRPFPRLLIGGIIGEKMLGAGRGTEAREILVEVVRPADLPPFHETMTALLCASQAVGDVDPMAAIEYAQRAVEVAGHLRKAVPLEEVKALAELALAKHLERGPRSAFPDWDRTATRLLEVRDDSDTWRDLFVMFGHATGFLATVAAGYDPPSETSDGEEYAPPWRGVFMTENRGRLDHFSEEKVLALPYIMKQYASSVGDPTAAARWSTRVASTGTARELPLLRAGIFRDQVPQLLLDGEVDRAISQAREAARIMVALADERRVGRHPRYSDPELDSIASGLSGDEATRADSLAAMMSVVPAVMRAATLHARAEPVSVAELYARIVIETCRSQSADGPGRDYWRSVAEPIELAFLTSSRFAKLLRWKESQGKLEPEREAITFIALAANATPEEAISVHLPIMPILEKWYESGGPVHHLILLPYVEEYWVKSFARMRFLFSRPTLVENLLPEALQAPEDQRVRAILKAILSGLRCRPPEALALWLYGKPA